MHEFLQRPEVIAVLEETRDEPEGDEQHKRDPDAPASSTTAIDATKDESTPEQPPSSPSNAGAVATGGAKEASGARDISGDSVPASPEIEATAIDRSVPAGGRSSSPEQLEKEPKSGGSAQVTPVKTPTGNSGNRSRSASSSSSSTASSGRRLSSSSSTPGTGSRYGGRPSVGSSGSRSSASPRSRVSTPGVRTLGSTGTGSGSSSSSKKETAGSSKGSKAEEGGVGGQGRGRGRGRSVRGGAGVRGGRARPGESGGSKRFV